MSKKLVIVFKRNLILKLVEYNQAALREKEVLSTLLNLGILNKELSLQVYFLPMIYSMLFFILY